MPVSFARTASFFCFTCPLLAAVISFSGTGQVSPTGPPDGLGNLPLMVVTPTTNYDLGDGNVWQLTSAFTSNLVTGLGSGTFGFQSGANGLSGTLTTAFGPGPGQFALAYLVTSGAGAYAGFQGSGSSIVQLLGDPNLPPTPFSESGSLTVVTPEPTSLGLLSAGLLALVARRRAGKARANKWHASESGLGPR